MSWGNGRHYCKNESICIYRVSVRPAEHAFMKIVFLCRSLNKGGAERQLVVLAKGLHRRSHEVIVVTFYPDGAFDDELRAAGVPLHCLAKSGRWDMVGFLRRLYGMLKVEKPAVVHGYLTIPNIFTVLMQLGLTGYKSVFGVRVSNMNLSYYDWTAKLSYRIECFLSRYADLIICNSRAGQAYALQRGFPEGRTISIANGIDTDRFRFDAEIRNSMRAEWGVPEAAEVIGTVARLDPMKGYELFLRAAAIYSQDHHNAVFVCVGEGEESYALVLRELAQELGISEKIKWAGAGLDTARVYSAFDLMVSASSGEGFSNVIGEAMSCGTPCVVTDVGDSALILGGLGEVVAVNDPSGMAAGWSRCGSRRAELLPEVIRGRIVDKFSIEALILNTERALQQLLDEK